MSKISLKSLHLKNFLSFVGEHSLNLPSKGLILLKGEHIGDEVVSNGSGKSNFSESIAYALDYSQSPATELQSWHTDESMKDRLVLDVDGKELIIDRSIGSYVTDFEGKKYYSQDAKDLLSKVLLSPNLLSFVTYRPQGVHGNFIPLSPAEKFDFLFDILNLNNIQTIIDNAKANIDALEIKNTEILSSTTQIENNNKQLLTVVELNQKQKSSFDKQKNDKVFNLESLSEPKLEEFHDKALKDKIIQELFTLNNIKLNKDDFVNKLLRDKLKDKLVAAEHARPKKDNSTINFKKLEKEKELKELSETASIRSQLLSVKKDNLSQCERSIYEAENEKLNKTRRLEEINSLYAQYSQAIHELKNIEKNIKDLDKGVCPACNRPVEDKDIKINQFLKEKADCLIIIEQWKEAEKEKQTLEKKDRLQELKQNISKLRLDIIELEKDIEIIYRKSALIQGEIQNIEIIVENDFQKQESVYNNVLAMIKKDLEICAQEEDFKFKVESKRILDRISILEQNLQDQERISQGQYIRALQDFNRFKKELETQINYFNQEIIKCNRDIENNNLKINLNNDKIKEILTLLDNNKNNINLEKEIINSLGKDNFSRFIIEETLDLIAIKANQVLSRLPNCNTYSIKFTTEQETKKGSLKKTILFRVIQGGEERAYKRLSGGEKCSVNLSVDAAIAEIINSRTGKDFGFFIADEIMTGLDVHSKMEAFEALKEIFKDKLLIIIEHSQEIEESVNNNEILLVRKNNQGFSSFANE